MKKTVLGAMLISTLTSISTSSQADPLAADNFSANIAITSNYLFRGISLSDDHPAVSGGFDWGYNGFYVGTWASSIDAVETESFEIDYYAGYTGEVGAFSYSIDFLYYDYPGQADSGPDDIGDLDYIEYGGSIGYTFGGDMAPSLGLSVLHSPDFYAETGDATAIEASFAMTLGAEIGMGLHYGTQELDDDYYDPDSYDYYGIDFTKTFGKFDVTVGYSDTDSDGEAFQGSDTSEVFVTVGASI